MSADIEPNGSVARIHRLIDDGKIWHDIKANWHSRCPTCRKARSHRNRGLAIDNVHTLCRKCHVERYGSPWQQLQLVNQIRRIEDY